jgi:hypothetical protein
MPIIIWVTVTSLLMAGVVMAVCLRSHLAGMCRGRSNLYDLLAPTEGVSSPMTHAVQRADPGEEEEEIVFNTYTPSGEKSSTLHV